MSKTYLKIKIMSLAAEAKIIRREEKKWPGVLRYIEHDGVRYPVPHPVREGLHNHRTYDVRNECRAALIAYGYLRGRSYAAIEAKCYTEPKWNRVLTLINKYGNKSLKDADLKAWAEAGVLGRMAA